MRNPIRSEGDAFRLVLLTIGYFALIVIGSLINSWVGLGVFLVLTGAGLWAVLRRREPEAPPRQAPAASPPDERRILVVANETVGGSELLAEIRARSAGASTVAAGRLPCAQLAAPALDLRRGRGPRRCRRPPRGEPRVDAHVRARRAGEIGDGDPIQAIEDALRTFRPDELIISTHPPGRSHWLERGVVEKTRERFALPVTHVVVDLDA